jgi:hypothetical protein
VPRPHLLPVLGVAEAFRRLSAAAALSVPHATSPVEARGLHAPSTTVFPPTAASFLGALWYSVHHLAVLLCFSGLTLVIGFLAQNVWPSPRSSNSFYASVEAPFCLAWVSS